MHRRRTLALIVIGLFLSGIGIGRFTLPAWAAATPREKLVALERLVGPAQEAVGELDQWVQRAKVILDSPEIKDDLTPTQKANLVAAWTDIRNEAVAAVTALPENLATWEPPEEEPEGPPLP